MSWRAILNGEKSYTAIIISVTALFIAALFLLLLYCIALKWEAATDNSILVKPEQGLMHDEGKPIKTFDLPLWIEFKVTNTGFRTFSVDYIFITAYGNKQYPEIARRVLIRVDAVNARPHNIRESFVSNEIFFPLVVEPGHSKKFYKLIKIPISNGLYNAYQKTFKGKAFSIGEVFSLNNEDLRVSSYYKIYAEIVLAGGKKRSAPVDIDEGNSE